MKPGNLCNEYQRTLKKGHVLNIAVPCRLIHPVAKSEKGTWNVASTVLCPTFMRGPFQSQITASVRKRLL